MNFKFGFCCKREGVALPGANHPLAATLSPAGLLQEQDNA
jgi:hypothetical protein